MLNLKGYFICSTGFNLEVTRTLEPSKEIFLSLSLSLSFMLNDEGFLNKVLYKQIKFMNFHITLTSLKEEIICDP